MLGGVAATAVVAIGSPPLAIVNALVATVMPRCSLDRR